MNEIKIKKYNYELKLYIKEIKKYNYDNKIENLTFLKRLNEIIYNTYDN